MGLVRTDESPKRIFQCRFEEGRVVVVLRPPPEEGEAEERILSWRKVAAEEKGRKCGSDVES